MKLRKGSKAGNGNGMQYLGCILLKSDLTLEELKDYYSTRVDKEWDCKVEKQTGQNLQCIEHGEVMFDTVIQSDCYYVVYCWGDGIEFFSEIDIRGH